MQFHTGVFEQLLMWPACALIYWVIGRLMVPAAGRPSWPVRVFVAAGAGAAAGGALFISWIFIAVRGARGLGTIGPVLIAALLGMALAAGVFAGAIILSSRAQQATRIVHATGALGFLAGMTAALYGGLFRW